MVYGVGFLFMKGGRQAIFGHMGIARTCHRQAKTNKRSKLGLTVRVLIFKLAQFRASLGLRTVAVESTHTLRKTKSVGGLLRRFGLTSVSITL